MTELTTEKLINELQSYGVRLADTKVGARSRRGGAGPSDHKAVTINGRTVMVPIHTAASFDSPYAARRPGADGIALIERDGEIVGRMSFPKQPRFYALQTFDGVPYWKIAALHSKDVLATTVLQTCIRYQSRTKTCQFCAIGQSLAAGRTVAHKTPEQLAEVARAAVLLDGVKHMVMTTGTPNATDRGAAVLCESAFAVKSSVDLPIQAQCEPPDADRWFERMKASGIDTLGMHVEAVTPAVRDRIMPGKASVPLERYMRAFEAAVPVFGRAQVSTYILAGLGDTREAILDMCTQLIARGVYPFVVPFVPIAGTPLEDHPTPSPPFMHEILAPLARMLISAGMGSETIKAGCGKCGACSALSTYEQAGQKRAYPARAEVPEPSVPPFRPVVADLMLEGSRGVIADSFGSFAACHFRLKYATEPWECDGAARLRREVFCDEQKIFEHHDRDDVDASAIHLVALSTMAVLADEVVGTVRIHEPEPGIWYGSRLAVDRRYRHVGVLGAALIRHAVSSAHAIGCVRFYAHVQMQNELLFRRLNWNRVSELEIHGKPHVFMQADLAAYPPLADPPQGFHALVRSAAA